MILDQLVAEAIDDGRLVLLQDSWLTGRRVLSRTPGAEVVELDGGCCGIAGSFGFETEHDDVSMAARGDGLFPAVLADR